MEEDCTLSPHAVEANGLYLELLTLKDLEASHGDLESLSVIVLQQMLDTTADKV